MKKIIIVDDEQDLLELAVDAFELDGFCAQGFSNAADALTYLANNEVDAVISDSNMPGMSGIQFFNQFKLINFGKNKPLFFLCTGLIDINEEELISSGMTKIITKPFDVVEMVDDVKAQLEIREKSSN